MGDFYQNNRHWLRRRAVWFGLGIALLAVAAAAAYFTYGSGHKSVPGKLLEVQSVKTVKESYDVVVVGTDPEGVIAAVSAARNGLSVLLADGRNRSILGGLMTLGWLNSIDHNYDREKKTVLPGQKPELLNKGLFSEWYAMVEGDSFDVTTAANALYALVEKEKNIDVLLKAKEINPLLISPAAGGNSGIAGLTIAAENGKSWEVKARTVIDATQDADIAAAAGVPYTIGREDIGDKKARMAVTLVFRLKNVTPDVWKQMQKRLRDDGNPNTDANERSAWGFVEMQNYPPENKERVRMRGLNVGRQNDDTALINALQIFGIDGLDPQSRAEAFEIGRRELPHIVEYMKKLYPEFAALELDGTAPELYVRETRHIRGEYRLNMIDVLENRDQWDRIALGSYPVDIQRISPTDNGAVMSHPLKYAIPFRSIVPLKVDGLLVVGRSASFDTLPHGSARVIPVGMAAAQAAGAAAKIAVEHKMTFREMAKSNEMIALLQDTLKSQGMELNPYTAKPADFMLHKDYEGLKRMVGLGLVIGGYDNSGFAPDPPSNAKRMENFMYGIRRVYANAFPGEPAKATAGIAEPAKTPLSLAQAAYTVTQTLGWSVSADQAVDELTGKGLLQKKTLDGIANQEALTNGDTYMLLKDVLDGLHL